MIQKIIQSKILNPKSNFVVISYWWGRGNINKNTWDLLTYEETAKRLIKNCEKNNCNYYIVEIPEFAIPGGYQKAINYKARFIKDTLDNIYPRNGLYIDTDMVIYKYPALFDLKDYDFIGYNSYSDPRGIGYNIPCECYDPYTMQTSGGIMCFGNTHNAKILLEMWENSMKKYVGKADDKILSYLFNKLFVLHLLRILWIPIEYFILPNWSEWYENYYVTKKYQKWFNNRDIYFYSNTESKEEYTTLDFYGISQKDIYIDHPEKLTPEEIAVKQGASSDRNIDLWFEWAGKKKRCSKIGRKYQFTNIPSLYLENKRQQKSLYNLNFIKDYINLEKLENEIPQIDKIKLNIFTQFLSYDTDFLFLSIIRHKKDFDKVDNFLNNCNKMNINCVLVDNQNDKLSQIIYYVMKKYNKSILYLDINCQIKKFPKLFTAKNIDFMALNSNYIPIFKEQFLRSKSCHDSRILKCLTEDVLFFKNNKYGRNLLKLWYNNNSLDNAFNRYSCVLFMRCIWLPISYFISSNIYQLLINKRININNIKTIIESSQPLKKLKKFHPSYYRREQCGIAPSLSKPYESLSSEHFNGTELTKYKYRKPLLEEKFIEY